MLNALRFAVPLACLSLIGCSSADFEVAGTPADGSTSADTGAVPADDTAVSPPTDSDVPGDGNSSVADAGPPCNTMIPAPACITPGSEYSPQFQYQGSTAIGPRVDNHYAHAISYVTARAGRHEKLILRLRRVASTGSTIGRLTLSAFYSPCPNVHVALGKSRSFSADAVYDGDVSFYFNDETTFLPPLPAGTRLTFVLSTDSTAFAFEVIGNGTPTDAPPSLKWWVRKDDGPWSAPSPALPAAQAWLRYCPG